MSMWSKTKEFFAWLFKDVDRSPIMPPLDMVVYSELEEEEVGPLPPARKKPRKKPKAKPTVKKTVKRKKKK